MEGPGSGAENAFSRYLKSAPGGLKRGVLFVFRAAVLFFRAGRITVNLHEFGVLVFFRAAVLFFFCAPSRGGCYFSLFDESDVLLKSENAFFRRPPRPF